MSQITRIISDIARRGVRYRSEPMKALGLCSRHTNYLLDICAEPGISQNRLAQRIGIDKSNVARQVASLEENGFITCTPCEKDRRITKLYPTEKTLALLPELTAMLDVWEAHLTQDMTAEEKETLTLLLTRIRDRADTRMEAENHAEA